MSNLKVNLGTRPLNLKVLKYLLVIIIYSLLITGSTYAYLTFGASNNALSGVGKCNIVNYMADEINATDLLSTTNYEEGASTTITLSQSEDCKIYTTVSIYLHTNDTTTAPIETVPALKYKIITEDYYEYNGTITTKGDYLLATVPLTSTEKTYTIYLWVDSDISAGSYNDVTYLGYIYAVSDQTSTVGDETTDTITPTLFLSKETYIEGFDGWTFESNSYVDSNNILILGEDESNTTSSAKSNYYNVDGKLWNYTYDVYTTSESSQCSPNGCVLSAVAHFDDNYNSATSSTGHVSQGNATTATLNNWTSISFKNHVNYICSQGPNVKNVKIEFRTDGDYSNPITKIRNLKVWGQLPNSFYLINISSSDNIGITETKYALGKQDKSYFTNNGTIITENQITVNENGIYTFYVKDIAGNETINTIEITRITS